MKALGLGLGGWTTFAMVALHLQPYRGKVRALL